jgi:hypothetical protein
MGAVFGPTDVFDSEKENGELVVQYSATVTSGTVLRIKYADLYRAKYGDAKNEEAKIKISPEEVAINSVSTAGNTVLSSDMNAFLRKNNLLPTQPTDNARKYVNYGSIGRTVPAQKREQDVMIILQGSVRVVLEKSIVSALDAKAPESDDSDDEERLHGEPVSMTCTRAGEPATNFKVRANRFLVVLCQLNCCAR